MLINQVNLNHLRVFECVCRTRSMTQAANELHLTQSGVSQHIKALEEVLEIKLFDRIKQRLVPTAAAVTLFQRCTKGFKVLEETLWEITGKEKDELTGTVSIGMPPEFALNILLPLITEFSSQHNEVRYKFRVGLASVLNQLILDGEIDFAFVDSFSMDGRITLERLYDEKVVLCMSPRLKDQFGAPKNNQEYYESLDYIAYEPDEPMIRHWMEHHIKTKKLELNVRAYVNDCRSVAQLIMDHTGAGVLPNHLVESLKQQGFPFEIFPGCGHPLKNAISAARLPERTQSLAAQTLLEFIKTRLKK